MQEDERRQLFDRLLTEQVYAQAWNHATRAARTREDAEDLLQEALGAAYRKLHQLREPQAFRAWLLTIVRTLGINRSRRRPAGLHESLWFQALAPAETQSALAEGIAGALAQLPAAHAAVLSLFYLDGLSLEETGKVLGIAPQAVGQRLHRARQALRRQFEQQPASGLEARGQANES